MACLPENQIGEGESSSKHVIGPFDALPTKPSHSIPVSFFRFLSAYLYQQNHPVMTANVRGTVTTQYSQNCAETVLLPSPEASSCQSNMPMLKSVAIDVPGRNSAVMKVNAITAMLSFLVEEAILMLSSFWASPMSFCIFAMRLYSNALALSLWLTALKSLSRRQSGSI